MAQPFVGACCHTAHFEKLSSRRSKGAPARLHKCARPSSSNSPLHERSEGQFFFSFFPAEPRALDRSRPFWSTVYILVYADDYAHAHMSARTPAGGRHVCVSTSQIDTARSGSLITTTPDAPVCRHACRHVRRHGLHSYGLHTGAQCDLLEAL